MSEYCCDSDFLPAPEGILHQAGGCRPASQTRFPGKIMGKAAAALLKSEFKGQHFMSVIVDL